MTTTQLNKHLLNSGGKKSLLVVGTIWDWTHVSHIQGKLPWRVRTFSFLFSYFHFSSILILSSLIFFHQLFSFYSFSLFFLPSFLSSSLLFPSLSSPLLSLYSLLLPFYILSSLLTSPLRSSFLSVFGHVMRCSGITPCNIGEERVVPRINWASWVHLLSPQNYLWS